MGLSAYLVLAALVFAIGLFGVLTRRNAIGILLGIELMLNAVNINLVAFARFHADLVGDGLEALRLASGGQYDLLVLDVRLPGMSGLELVRTLRDRGLTSPILMLTAQDSVDFKVQALRAGADDYMTKPFAFEELLARVEALGRRPKELAPPVLQAGARRLQSVDTAAGSRRYSMAAPAISQAGSTGPGGRMPSP